MDGHETMEFRYRDSLRWVPWMAELACAGLLVANGPEFLRRREWVHFGSGVAWVVIWGCWVAWDWLQTRNGSVAVNDVGLRIRDWRGGETSLAWGEVEEVWVISGMMYGSRLQLRARGRKYYLHNWISGPVLAREIVRRAELTVLGSNWWGTVYRRPAVTLPSF